MKQTIQIFNSVDELSHFFAHQLIARIQEKSKGSYFSIALSGGSTPKSVFEYLASNFKHNIPWEKIIVFWGDERCVAPENNESNYKMAKENLLDRVPIPANHIFRIMGENEPSVESSSYSAIVKQNLNSDSDIPQFDLIMLGLGDDGHTASIFPGNPHLLIGNKLFDVAENPYTRQKRITATFNIINQALSIVFFVTGKSKAEMLANIIERKDGSEKLPASMVQPVYGDVTWLLDVQSASKLSMQQDG
jgi:6-phosphogluconolactonase